MKKALIALFLTALWTAPVWAQDRPLPPQVSTSAEGSHVFAGTTISSLTVTWHESSAENLWLMIFDGTAVPSNGAVTSCTATQASGCLAYCSYLSGSSSFGDGSAVFGNDIFPLVTRNGVVAVVSTTGCVAMSLTADGAHDLFAGQVR